MSEKCPRNKSRINGAKVALSPPALAAVMMVWAAAAMGDETPESWESWQDELVIEALVYDIQRHSRLDVLAKLVTYHTLANDRKSNKEIRKELLGIDRRFARGAATSGPDDTARETAGTVMGIAVGTLTRSWQLGALGREVGGALTALHHEATGQGLQTRLEQRRAQRLLGEGARATVERAVSTCSMNLSCMREFKDLFGTRVGPDDDIDSIAEQMPELAEFKAVLSIQDEQERTRKLIEQTKAVVERSQGELSRIIREGQERTEELLLADWQRERQRELARKKAAIAQVKMEGLQGAAFVASSIVGLVDPRAGRQLGAVAQATLQVFDAVQKFNANSKLADGLTGFAGAALTGDVLGAGLTLIGTFIDMGPTADQLMLSEIGKVREQLQTLRGDMHKRFGRLEAQNVAIFDSLDQGFSAIQKHLEAGNEETWRRLTTIHQELEQQSQTLKEVQNLIIGQTELLIAYLHATEIESCVQMKEDFPTRRMSEDQFVECIGKIRALATSGHLDQLQFSEGDRDPVVGIVDSYDRSVRLAMKKMVAMHPLELAILPERIVGPAAWRALADAHDKVMADWPEQANLLQGTGYGEAMAAYRRDLILAADAIAEDYARFELGDPSAFGAWYHGLRKRIKNLEESIKNAVTNLEEEGKKGESDHLAYLGPYDGLGGPYDGRDRSTMQRDIGTGAWERAWPQGRGETCRVKHNDNPLRRPELAWNEDLVNEDLVKADFVLAPQDRLEIDTAKDKIWHRWMNDMRRKTRRILEESNPGLVNMINMNMVDIFPCIYGWSQTRIAEIGTEKEVDEWRSKHRGQDPWGLEQTAYMLAKLKIEIKCGGEKVIEEFDGFMERREEFHEFAAITKYGRTVDHRIVSADHQEVERSMMRAAIQHLIGDVERANNSLMGVEVRACRETLERRYHGARREISKAAAEKLSKSDEWKKIQQEFEEADVYLAAWLLLAGVDGLEIPAPAAAIVTGAGQLPDPDSILGKVIDSGEPYLWEVPDILRAELDRSEALLGHREISEWMNGRRGSYRLRNTAYLGID